MHWLYNWRYNQMYPVWRKKIVIRNIWSDPFMLWVWCLVPLLTLFQLYRGDVFILFYFILFIFFFLVKETGVHRESESYRPVASHWPTLSHNVILFYFKSSYIYSWKKNMLTLNIFCIQLKVNTISFHLILYWYTFKTV